jgi:hypothetical protein
MTLNQNVMNPTSPFFVLFVKNRPKHKWRVQDLPRHITSISRYFCKTNENKTFESIQYYLAIYVFVFKPMDLVLRWLLFYLFCSSIVINAVIVTAEPLRCNESGRFGTVKSDSTHHFFRNACTKSGSLWFSQFSGCWLILSVYILMSFDFPFGRMFGVW